MSFDASDIRELGLWALPLAQRAGAVIMDIYKASPEVRYKADRSPVTDADVACEHIILKALSRLAGDIPVVAEEALSCGAPPRIADRFFLIDPVDGTKEFIRANGEFTVNIALVENRAPVFGLVYAPAFSDCYVTLGTDSAVRLKLVPDHNPEPRPAYEFQPISGERPHSRGFTAIVSRSNQTPATESFLRRIGDPPCLRMGSSLKFGVVARGDADVYPRFAPTSEWDIAAGHALVNAAGGCVLTETGEPLDYGKIDRNFANPSFVVWRRRDEAEAILQGA
ncbi:3'(2'),5'-bisphosphate nucleotidase CysQ [Rhodomicrobium lacus]|uniref:3'(2'),5'-bisphosphate nucleotidase CysQ n=1 Tax=Rhodomicrobium lacus TaxID=2498452 RepID=UPI001FDEB9D1|nr:3'(2'),5'-bisphosphate nucleotidase CysQ [Rhodomicrobium lacus]